EAAGVVEQVGREARGVAVGDHVVLSWNPHCGHCFYCDRDLPILCEAYLGQAPLAVQFDGASRARLRDGRELKHLMRNRRLWFQRSCLSSRRVSSAAG
ncbi:MAG: alcohol dehydrogenase catalytic domain-containing protein, partial [Bradyrhizobium sp.]